MNAETDLCFLDRNNLLAFWILPVSISFLENWIEPSRARASLTFLL